MLSKNKIKFIQSLERKKARKEYGCFLAEGNKLVEDTIVAFSCKLLVATSEWLQAHPRVQADEVVEASPDEICRASLLSSPQDVIAVYEIPQYTVQPTSLSQQLVLALDTVQDPGNLGTIVRIADWYGIEHILCSPLCADLYNPKVVLWELWLAYKYIMSSWSIFSHKSKHRYTEHFLMVKIFIPNLLHRRVS